MRTDIQYQYDPPHALLCLSGELDLATRTGLRDAFGAVRIRGCTRVDVDAEGVTFIDASCLGVLAREQRRWVGDGGELTVIAGSRYYRLVAGLAGHDELLPDQRGAASPYAAVL